MHGLSNAPLIAIHASAAKDYKKWPADYFAELISALNQQGYKIVLIGAGHADQQANSAILKCINTNYSFENGIKNTDINCTDLCNQLSLYELATLTDTM